MKQVRLLLLAALFSAAPARAINCDVDGAGGPAPLAADVTALAEVVVGANTTVSCAGDACDFDGNSQGPDVGDVAALLTLVNDATAAAGACDGLGTATYTAAFTTNWTATTHPNAHPGQSAHFSALIGASHTTGVSYWSPGSQASTAIQSMAERGVNSDWASLIADEIAAGRADQHFNQGAPTTQGTLSFTVTLSASHPLLTFTTMIAPSPDWFIGVHDVNLRQGGTWVNTVSLDLLPYDAGTDDGATFTAANAPSAPHVPIALLTNPFDGTTPLGTLTLTKH